MEILQSVKYQYCKTDNGILEQSLLVRHIIYRSLLDPYPFTIDACQKCLYRTHYCGKYRRDTFVLQTEKCFLFGTAEKVRSANRITLIFSYPNPNSPLTRIDREAGAYRALLFQCSYAERDCGELRHQAWYSARANREKLACSP